MERVLLVEDNADLAENLAEVLSDIDVETTIVHSAEAALEECRRTPFAAIVTDLRLPGQSGIDLIEQLRARQVTSPIVVISAYADDNARERAEELGAIQVLSKPVDLSRLMELLQSVEGDAKCVLVVEDTDDLADNLAQAVSEMGGEPLVVRSVEQAFAQRRFPAVAVVDLRLPDGDGIQAIRRLCARDPKLAVIVTSGHVDAYTDELAEVSARYRRVEMPPMEKPVPVDLLMQKISEGLRRS